MSKTRFITQAAVIAALYAALTIIFQPVSFLQTQVRVSEGLTVLPIFTPAAIPGLFLGCLIANIFSPVGILDVILGSLATLIAAVVTYKMPKPYLAPIPPIVINGIVIGSLLNYVMNLPLVPSMLWVALGQAITCYGLGYPLILILNKLKDKVFFRGQV
ncbi:MAG: QueT transporter family protein [Acetivibrionales bacterium]